MTMRRKNVGLLVGLCLVLGSVLMLGATPRETERERIPGKGRSGVVVSNKSSDSEKDTDTESGKGGGTTGPANQICPPGQSVVGFDSSGNIICATPATSCVPKIAFVKSALYFGNLGGVAGGRISRPKKTHSTICASSRSPRRAGACSTPGNSASIIRPN